MAQTLDAYRQAAAKLAADKLGFSYGQNRSTEAQQRLRGFEGSLFSLPVDLDNYSELQDPDTGRIYFMAGFDHP